VGGWIGRQDTRIEQGSLTLFEMTVADLGVKVRWSTPRCWPKGQHYEGGGCQQGYSRNWGTCF